MWRPWQDNNDIAGDDDEREPVPGTSNEHYVSNKKHLTNDCKKLVLNVFEGLCTQMKKSDAINQTVFLTKVCRATVYTLIKTGVKDRKKREDSGTFKKIQSHLLKPISDVIYQMFAANIMPNLNNLLATLKEKFIIEDCSTQTLGRFLKQHGFRYKIVNKRQAIMESARLIKWRNEYIEKITECRNKGQEIYYLDETWFDSHDTTRRAWTDDSMKSRVNVPHNRGKRICILHCGGSNGWVNDALLLTSKYIKDSSLDYHQDIESTIFESWFEETLLPKIKPNSVIILDNASYHSRQTDKIPTKYSNKATIQEFLEAEDLYYEEHYTKAQLVEVLQLKIMTKKYFIDETAVKNGHTVLRLPPYYCVLNPIELLWSQLKCNVRKHNTCPKSAGSVITLIQEEFKNISAENWKNAIDHVIKIEKEYMRNVPRLQKIIINVNDTDSESENDFELE